MLPIAKSLDVQEHEEVVDGSYVPDPPPKFVLPWQPCCPRTPGGPQHSSGDQACTPHSGSSASPPSAPVRHQRPSGCPWPKEDADSWP